MSSEKNIDNVNNPSHYSTGKYNCFDVMREALGDDIVKGFCLGNAFKYIYRTGRKNGLEDIKKAQWYIDHYIQICEGTCEELECSEDIVDDKDEFDKYLDKEFSHYIKKVCNNLKPCTDDEECNDIAVN